MPNQKYLEGTFSSEKISKFINHWFFSGLNFKFEKLLYLSFLLLKNKLNCCPIWFFFEALEKIKPLVGLKLYTKTKKTKKITKIIAAPYYLILPLQYKKAIFWLSKATQSRFEKYLVYKISNELYSINILNSGGSFKKKLEFYRYAIAFKNTKRFKW